VVKAEASFKVGLSEFQIDGVRLAVALDRTVTVALVLQCLGAVETYAGVFRLSRNETVACGDGVVAALLPARGGGVSRGRHQRVPRVMSTFAARKMMEYISGALQSHRGEIKTCVLPSVSWRGREILDKPRAPPAQTCERLRGETRELIRPAGRRRPRISRRSAGLRASGGILPFWP
jgi:hypothetical protein